MLLDIIGLVLVLGFLTICLWGLYNLPILIMGIKDFRRNRQKKPRKNLPAELLPTVSIVLPVKNEESVVGTLLNALSKLNYPANKREIIIVEDGSADKTLDICMNYAAKHAGVKILHRSSSNGKPSALNYGITHAKGEIIAIFDADSVPDPNALMAASEYFEDPKVAAVQGKTLSLNPKKNMLTQFVSYEETVWCEVFLRGKDLLNLFVHLKGSCQFIRRDVLEKVKGFDEAVLCEDMEVSAKFLDNGYKIRYGSNVIAWQESPSDLKTLFNQRTRWFRGTMEVAIKYGRLMAKLSRINFDAETTLFAPFLLVASLLPYLATVWAIFAILPFNMLWLIALPLATLTTALSLLVCGFALIYVTKPRKARSLLWLPFIYFYWSFQSFIALYALLLIVLRRPRRWSKTDKQGTIANSTIVSEKVQVNV
jgi:cellulose synthase/poly-beta-1,6-N-acetylglucosamine synthase-like glycosyltransferase